MKRFYTEDEMAGIMCIQRVTLQNKRYAGAGHPPYKKINGMVLYPIKDADQWLDGFETRRELAEEYGREIQPATRSKAKAG
jgi:hypothetical protein